MNYTLVLFEADPDFRHNLETVLEGHQVLYLAEGEGSLESLDPGITSNTKIILGNPPLHLLSSFPNLIWIQLQSAGADAYTRGDLDRSVLLSCATGVYGHTVSEHMVAMTLLLQKKLHLYRDQQPQGLWTDRGSVKSIDGSVVLVLGLGDIGSGYARRMKALGAQIMALRRSSREKPEYVDQLIRAEELEGALARADVVALALPQTDETRGFIGRKELSLMKQEAIIINAGRGSAIDTQALVEALQGGTIAGAGLDVTDPEPLPADHPLWKLENALITPHVSGGRFMKETGQYMMDLNLSNARRYMKGQTLESLVDYETGYRSLSRG
ncbi:MAG: D-2-hydroxyacid dehydrogenase [Treponema sp.]|nr:D-2-hydroxyacid dehydrogenase [Treponema sp.]